MTFTDEDLKRLKEANHFDEHDILALIARLEAAESVCDGVEMMPRRSSVCIVRLERWREAAGK